MKNDSHHGASDDVSPSETHAHASSGQPVSMAERLVGIRRRTGQHHAKLPSAVSAAAWAVWLYVVSVLLVAFVLRLGGDRWWFATVMLFGPRWIYGLPLVLLVPLVLFLRRRLLWPMALSLVILVGPIMGCCIPWSTFFGSGDPVLRVVTWNVRNDCVNNESLAALIHSAEPDIVALQECRIDLQLDWPAGWHVRRQGRLVVGSRYRINSAEFSQRRWPPSRWPPENALHCTIQTPNDRIELVNVHLRTPRRGLEEVLSRRTLIRPSQSGALSAEIEYRRMESQNLVDWIGRFSADVVIAGDFNMPADSSIYRQVWSKYANAFSIAGLGFGYTKRTKVLAWRYGSRIDHILTGPEWRPYRCWIGPDLGSDHLPLIADFCPAEPGP